MHPLQQRASALKMFSNLQILWSELICFLCCGVEHGEICRRIQEKIIMADLSKLTAAVAKLSADVNALLASDAAVVQPSIDAATAAVEAVDATVVAATPTV